MLKFLRAASLAAMTAACSTAAPTYLAAPADPRSPHNQMVVAPLLKDARTDAPLEPAEWQDLNRRVAPKGGKSGQ